MTKLSNVICLAVLLVVSANASLFGKPLPKRFTGLEMIQEVRSLYAFLLMFSIDRFN